MTVIERVQLNWLGAQGRRQRRKRRRKITTISTLSKGEEEENGDYFYTLKEGGREVGG